LQLTCVRFKLTPFFTYAPNADLVGDSHACIQSNDVTKGT
jgi:hypothetical protein